MNALTHILASRWTWLKPVFSSKPFWWAFYPLYQIITYNRRVIAGCKACDGFDCAPDLNRFYRSLYLVICALLVGLIAATTLASATTHSATAFGLLSGFGVVGLVAGSIIRLTGSSVSAWDYFGNYATTAVIVGSFLVPITVWPSMPEPIVWFVIGSATFMGLAELRRRRI